MPNIINPPKNANFLLNLLQEAPNQNLYFRYVRYYEKFNSKDHLYRLRYLASWHKEMVTGKMEINHFFNVFFGILP